MVVMVFLIFLFLGKIFVMMFGFEDFFRRRGLGFGLNFESLEYRDM